MLESKLNSLQRTLKKTLTTLLVTTLLSTTSLSQDNYKPINTTKPKTDYSQEDKTHTQLTPEPTRKDYLAHFKQTLGKGYQEIQNNPNKKKIWDTYWETASKEHLQSLVNIYDLEKYPIKHPETQEEQLAKITSFNKYFFLKSYPWVNQDNLSLADKRILILANQKQNWKTHPDERLRLIADKYDLEKNPIKYPETQDKRLEKLTPLNLYFILKAHPWIDYENLTPADKRILISENQKINTTFNFSN